MELIIQAINAILAPLSPELVFAVLIAGIFFGMIYVFRLNVDLQDMFHLAMSGWVFIASVFLFRLFVFLAGGGLPDVGFIGGWVGIGILWALYCVFIGLGTKIMQKIKKFKDR